MKKVDVIALIGNSGAPSCSIGVHLHFEVRGNGSLRDPASYLKSISLAYEDDQVAKNNGSGSWDWPIGEPKIT